MPAVFPVSPTLHNASVFWGFRPSSKAFLGHVLNQDVTLTREQIDTIVPARQASVRNALESIGNPVAALHHMRALMADLVGQLAVLAEAADALAARRTTGAARAEAATDPVMLGEGGESGRPTKGVPVGGKASGPPGTNAVVVEEEEEGEGGLPTAASWGEAMATRARRRAAGLGVNHGPGDGVGGGDGSAPAMGETPLLMLDRWRELRDELYDEATGFDITKVSIMIELTAAAAAAADVLKC